MRFGAVPTGVASPPSDGAYAAIRRTPVRSRAGTRPSAASARGRMIAVVAVLFTHAEMPHPRTAMAQTRRLGSR